MSLIGRSMCSLSGVDDLTCLGPRRGYCSSIGSAFFARSPRSSVRPSPGVSQLGCHDPGGPGDGLGDGVVCAEESQRSRGDSVSSCPGRRPQPPMLPGRTARLWWSPSTAKRLVTALLALVLREAVDEAVPLWGWLFLSVANHAGSLERFIRCLGAELDKVVGVLTVLSDGDLTQQDPLLGRVMLEKMRCRIAVDRDRRVVADAGGWYAGIATTVRRALCAWFLLRRPPLLWRHRNGPSRRRDPAMSNGIEAVGVFFVRLSTAPFQRPLLRFKSSGKTIWLGDF